MNCLTAMSNISVLCLILSLLTVGFCGKIFYYLVCTRHYLMKNTHIYPQSSNILIPSTTGWQILDIGWTTSLTLAMVQL